MGQYRVQETSIHIELITRREHALNTHILICVDTYEYENSADLGHLQ